MSGPTVEPVRVGEEQWLCHCERCGDAFLLGFRPATRKWCNACYLPRREQSHRNPLHGPDSDPDGNGCWGNVVRAVEEANPIE